MSAPSLKIFFHDRCFDGAASAALFADFYRAYRGADGPIAYQGMSHSQADPFQDIAIDGDENACLDFRYSPHPKMNWWFDHHVSGFQPPALRAHFEAENGQTKFFDPEARSCAIFMQRTFRERFAYQPGDEEGHWAELVNWADKIDGAVFSSAAEIVELKSSALQLMAWLKSNHDPALASAVISQMGQVALDDIIAMPALQERLPSLLQAHHKSTEWIARELRFDGRVATYDLSAYDAEGGNGFAVYMLQPECSYAIGLIRSNGSVAISLGINPWVSKVGDHNLARICERYGGGGHPHVGGISMPADQLERAREIVEEIRKELHGDR